MNFQDLEPNPWSNSVSVAVKRDWTDWHEEREQSIVHRETNAEHDNTEQVLSADNLLEFQPVVEAAQAQVTDHADYYPRPSPIWQEPTVTRPKLPRTGSKATRDENVLFDADNLSSDESVDDFGDFGDFGDFVDGQQPASEAKQNIDLLDVGEENSGQNVTAQAPKLKVAYEAAVKHAGRTSATNTQSSDGEDFSSWNDWEPQITKPRINDSALAFLELPKLPHRRLQPARTVTAPRNIPPPAILLTLFPPLIDLLKTEVFDHLSNAITHTKDQAILQNPAVLLFLESCLALAAVLAHVIAGRKLRWKRDSNLSQSMSIGNAGRVSGMKLTSLDKSEDVKEEREVQTAVRMWQSRLGRLKSTLVSAGISQPVPDVATVLPVRTLQANEGGLLATRACALCALKRNERVPKVDLNVYDDEFGDFWMQDWGHRSCYEFWDSQEFMLRSR